jgi:hypothetical protein
MKPYGSDVMNVRAPYQGFRAAADRFQIAAKRRNLLKASVRSGTKAIVRVVSRTGW